MKIIGLQSNNIKRLKAVDLKFDDDGKLIIISGKNAQGKTSLLDSIWMALAGTKAIPSKPIRDGEESADITLDIKGEKLSFTVKRTFTEKSSTLTIVNTEGKKYSNPQEMLNHLIGNLTFDPLAFTRLTNKEQVQQLMDITGLSFEEIDGEIKFLREERTALGRVVKTFAKIEDDDIKAVTDLACKQEVSVAKLSEGYTKLSAEARVFVDAQGRILTLNKQLADLNKEVVELQKLKMPKEDLEKMKLDIEGAEESNKAIRDAKSKANMHNSYCEKKNGYETMTETIKAKEEQKKKMLSEVKMPVENLSWDEDGVKYGELPFNQLSGAEQLRVSMAIAMSAKPHLRVIVIKDGSLLDKDSLSVIETMAVDQDFQVWMECVDESGEVGIFIEDGEVKKINK